MNHIGAFFLGLAVLPIAAAVASLFWWSKTRIARLIEMSNPGNVHVRAALAARVFASRRAFVARFRHATLSLTLGQLSYTAQNQAEAALLDEFAPVAEAAA